MCVLMAVVPLGDMRRWPGLGVGPAHSWVMPPWKAQISGPFRRPMVDVSPPKS